MGYRIGIDVGSKTIKGVAIDDNGAIVHSFYQRHRSDLRTTIRNVLHDFAWRHGNVQGPVAITGSAGIAVAEIMKIPFVQEVTATTRALQALHPQADCAIEIGGEDAKVIYLSGGLEQRMNATCAGGTGGFIDSIAHMLGIRSRNMGSLALGAQRTYPIASRCAVFAQSDVRPLMNSGATKADIAASALEAVARQTIGGLACGRPLKGTVVFLGGPFEHNPALVMAFRKAIGLNNRTGVKPRNAHLYTAYGAALSAPSALDPKALSAVQLEEIALSCPDPADDLQHLPPLFRSDEERALFESRHARQCVARVAADQASAPFFLGVDSGSTAVKCAVVDARGRLVLSDYRKSEGDALGVATAMLTDIQARLRGFVSGTETPALICHSTACGYGEDLMRSGLGVDSGVVETLAHLQAARAFEPDVSFVLDIGGQDMKALWVRDGILEDAVLNEACSSGCGSFIEGTARSLHISHEAFSDAALHARNPIDLGTKCTVFMSSRVRHAQKVGASREDIAAGIAYSVVRNALQRIIGPNRAARLGDKVVVQGGAFKSDAVLRAFELDSGIQAIRPDAADIMGAFGCALIARERWIASGARPNPSTLLDLTRIACLSPTRKNVRCEGCENRCRVSILDFGTGYAALSGNRCDRAWDFAAAGFKRLRVAANTAPNVITVQQRLLAGQATSEPASEGERPTIGILDTLNVRENLPFWKALLQELGFKAATPNRATCETVRARSAESITSESACYPAKLSHERLYALLHDGCDAVFAPQFKRGNHCPVASGYFGALIDNLPDDVADETRTAVGASDAAASPTESLCATTRPTGPSDAARFVSPLLAAARPERISSDEASLDALAESLSRIKRPQGEITRVELERACVVALEAQRSYRRSLEKSTRKALAWVHADGTRRGVVVDGRPYHNDASVMHRIDEMLADMGVAVIPSAGLICVASSEGRDLSLSEKPSWSKAKHILKVMRAIQDDPQLEMVALRSFNCGFDAASFDVAREHARKTGQLFTELKIDEMTDLSHIKIRLRTLVETLGLHNAYGPHGLGGPVSRAGGEGADTAGRPNRETPHGARAIPYSGEIDAHDLSLVRKKATCDLCFTAQALAAHTAHVAAGNPDAACIEVPRVCEACLVDALPFELERISASPVQVKWADGPTDTWPTAHVPTRGADANDASSPNEDDERGSGGCLGRENARGMDVKPVVGIIGNPLLCFDLFMNEGVVSLIERLGCTVALPEPDALFTEDTRYLGQLDRFRNQGVHHVIYLQSFGCLKGHVQARGSQALFKQRYPDMPVTVIDYNPDSSALNRENRIRLVVEDAFARARRVQDSRTSKPGSPSTR